MRGFYLNDAKSSKLNVC